MRGESCGSTMCVWEGSNVPGEVEAAGAAAGADAPAVEEFAAVPRERTDLIDAAAAATGLATCGSAGAQSTDATGRSASAQRRWMARMASKRRDVDGDEG